MAKSKLSPFERHLREVLASAGFEVDVFRGGHVLEAPTALAVLETRRGKWSTATELEVLMSISVTSRVLADTFGDPVVPAPPTFYSHWFWDPIHSEGDPDLWDVPKDEPGSWDQRDADLSQRCGPGRRRGAIQTSYTYESYGKRTVTGQANANSQQFTGRENETMPSPL